MTILENSGQAKLIPQWEIGERILYKVDKSNSFRFRKSESEPYESSYTIELKLLEEKLIEAYFPQSLLSASQYFNPIREYIPQLINPQSTCLYYSTDHEFHEVELRNSEALANTLKQIESDLSGIYHKQRKQRKPAVDFAYLYDNYHELEYCLLEDIRILHEFYGVELTSGIYFDLDTTGVNKGKFFNKMLSILNLKMGSVKLLKFNHHPEKGFQVEYLYGMDTFSTRKRHDFNKIREAFLRENFDFEHYEDITLHYKKFRYHPETNILQDFQYKMKTDTPRVKKQNLVYISIEY